MGCDWLRGRDLRGHYVHHRTHCKTAHGHFLQDTLLAARPAPPPHPDYALKGRWMERAHDSWEVEGPSPARAGPRQQAGLRPSPHRGKARGGGEMKSNRRERSARVEWGWERGKTGDRGIVPEKGTPTPPTKSCNPSCFPETEATLPKLK